MVEAPLYHELAQAPQGGRAYWLTARDGTRLRMALWPEGKKGTVLLLPGRTEYIEKYGETVGNIIKYGYAVAVIDWRGQGLSDRPEGNQRVGYVLDFSLYQNDLQAVFDKLDELDQSGPFYMLAHSMGGAIGLAALMQPNRFKAASFSAPMWGINFPIGFTPVASGISQMARALGQGLRFAPGTGPQTYVKANPFKGNAYSSDPERYALLQAQADAKPELTLGGPSLHWLDEALRETRRLAALPSPDIPTFCGLGSNERVVAPAAIHARMANWPKGQLEILAGAEHEIMLETPEIRHHFLDRACTLFAAHP